MIHGKLTDESGNCLILNVSKTNNIFERMRGLLGSSPLKDNEGLLIVPCSSVHTFGMRFTIDLIFLDKNWTVVKIVKTLKPWRMAFSRKASMVLELAVDSLDRLNILTGQKIEWHEHL